jgi:hypothetical protein
MDGKTSGAIIKDAIHCDAPRLRIFLGTRLWAVMLAEENESGTWRNRSSENAIDSSRNEHRFHSWSSENSIGTWWIPARDASSLFTPITLIVTQQQQWFSSYIRERDQFARHVDISSTLHHLTLSWLQNRAQSLRVKYWDKHAD